MSYSSPKPELYRLLVHPLMSVVVPVSGILALLYIGAAFAGVSGPRTITVVGVVLAPVVEAAVGNLLYRERAGIGNRIRELIIFLLVFYVVLSLAREGAIAERFRPGAEQILPIAAIAFTWSSAFSLHNRLRGREALLRAFHGKDGNELRRALIDRQHDMALTVREMRHARGSMIMLFFFVGMLGAIVSSGIFLDSSLPVQSPGFVLLAISGLATALGAGAMNAFIQEYAAHGDGLRVPFRFHRRRLLASVVLVFLVVGLSFGLSRHSSLLPVDPILDFFRWLGSLFDRDRSPAPPPLLRSPGSTARYEQLGLLLQQQEPVVPPLWLRLLAELLRRFGIAVAAGVASVLVFGPLFSPAFRRGLRQIRPRRLIREAWRRFVRQLRIILRWLRARTTHRRESTAAAPGIKAAGSGARQRWKPSIVKRRQMDRVVSVFVSVTRWGAAHGVPYRRTEAAWEYLSRIAELHAEHYAAARTCREVFWEARYSRRTVPRVRMREFFQAARRITGSG